MGKLAALRPHAVEIRARARIELDFDTLILAEPEGRLRPLPLERAEILLADAELSKRFVRHLRITAVGEQIDLVTPPEDGAIAPRCAQTPPAPPMALVIDRRPFAVLAEWIATRGSLHSLTIPELVDVAAHATSAYAVHIGWLIGQAALAAAADIGGPLRGCPSPRTLLKPLHAAAQSCERAADALCGALSVLEAATD